MQCVICESKRTKHLKSNYPGYDEGDVYDIYSCEDCKVHFAAPYRVPTGIYERLHAHKPSSVYNVLYERANGVIKAKDPFAFLLQDSHSYYPVSRAIDGKKNLKILEIGCSNGYLVHALRTRGHDAFGIDLSKNAISFAQKHFGDHYMNVPLNEYVAANPEARFDLIVSLEVIEHLTNVPEFVEQCLELLTPDGSFVFTTPNRDYFPENSVWCNDQPPVHLLWYSPQTFEVLAEKLGAKVSFVDFKDHVSGGDIVNEFVGHFMRKKVESIPPFHFDDQGNTYVPSADSRVHRSIKKSLTDSLKRGVKKTARSLLIENRSVRYIANKLYRRLLYSGINDFATIGGVMKKA